MPAPLPFSTARFARFGWSLLAPLVFLAPLVAAQPLAAAPRSFDQVLSADVAETPAIANFYRMHGYADLWTGDDDADRRAALFAALDQAGTQGLPVARYDAAVLRAAFRALVTQGDRGRLEATMTRAYLAFARDLSSGALEPGEIDATIVRAPVRPDPAFLLSMTQVADFAGFLAKLPPNHPEYAALIREKIRLENRLATGGFGPIIAAESLAPGDVGAAVVALRDRLQAFGYLGASATRDYDGQVTAAVQRFQLDSGLSMTGIAGASTIAALNAEPSQRLQAVVVALERLRWMGDAPWGKRYIWVNQPDFTAQVVDDGKVTFQTRVVIGKTTSDTRSPEFSDLMEFMVINPSWSVPRSITTKEYLPMLRANPNAVGHLQLIDRSGRVVSRDAVNFAAYSAANFPYALRQAPSDGNALGKVKFMFPNAQNIYLHDTPTKSLFANEVRAYSHGCIRVGAPFDLAYVLLAPQSDDPKALFQSYLDGGRESRLAFDTPIPVHLVYFTAWPNAKGMMTYRQDIYGRDTKIFDALRSAELAALDVQG